jgi:hypothetical protein
MNISPNNIVAVLLAAAVSWSVSPAVAVPISPLELRNSVGSSVETVQYRRGWRGGYRGGGFGGPALGLAAGAIIGGAIIGATQPWGYYGYSGYGPGYGYSPGYRYAPAYGYAPDYDQGYVVESPYGGGDAVAYCQQRFRSYDPRSGTYLGFDGVRHSCP